MKQFFKMFFASMLAMIVTGVIVVGLIIGLIVAAMSKSTSPDSKVNVAENSVLIVDLDKAYHEQGEKNSLAAFNDDNPYTAGLYDVVKAVAVSHDGQYIVSGGGEPWAVSNDNRVLIWDMETGEELAACEGHSNSVTSVAFSPINNTVLSGSRDGTMRLWNWRAGSGHPAGTRRR